MINSSRHTENNSVAENIARINENIMNACYKSGRSFSDVSLMAVTKTVDEKYINQAYDCGIRLFGENRVQEFLDKRGNYKYSSENIHFIGHLQTNKVKYIIDKVNMIESVDSVKLAAEISKQVSKSGIDMFDILIEVNIGEEESKSGINPAEIRQLADFIAGTGNLRLRGLMAIPPVGRSDYFFAKMKQLFVDIKDKNVDNSIMDVLSMGMSGDYVSAIENGATLVRIGSAIFGKRK